MASGRVRMTVRVAAGLWLAAAGFAAGQQGGGLRGGVRAGGEAEKVIVRDFAGLRARDRVRTPDYSFTARNMQPSTTPRREWLRLGVEYDTAPDWIDELVFRYYALFAVTEKGKRRPVLLRGTVKYRDIEKGRRHTSVMYLHPNALERYGDPVAIAVEILMDGQTVAQRNEDRVTLAEKWWSSADVPAVDRYLLNRLQTPFVWINYDDYEYISP